MASLSREQACVFHTADGGEKGADWRCALKHTLLLDPTSPLLGNCLEQRAEDAHKAPVTSLYIVGCDIKH